MKIDKSRRMVRATVKDKAAFSADALNAALATKGDGYKAENLQGPTG